MSTPCAVCSARTTHTLGAVAVTAKTATALGVRGSGHVKGGGRAVVDAAAVEVAVSTADVTHGARISARHALVGTLLTLVRTKHTVIR